jgi:hypothetical protein
MDVVQNDASISYSVDVCVFSAAITSLPSRCLAAVKGHSLMGGLCEVCH